MTGHVLRKRNLLVRIQKLDKAAQGEDCAWFTRSSSPRRMTSNTTNNPLRFHLAVPVAACKRPRTAQIRRLPVLRQRRQPVVRTARRSSPQRRRAGLVRQLGVKLGDHLLERLNDGLTQSRKTLAVWSQRYFANRKVWTLAESMLSSNRMCSREEAADPAVERALRHPAPVPQHFISQLPQRVRFRPPFRQLLEALELPERETGFEDTLQFREHEVRSLRARRLAQHKGKRFEDEVATLYRLLGFEVTEGTQVSGIQIDLQIRKREGGLITQAIVECKDTRVTAKERNQILAQQNIAQKKLPKHRWITVSSEGFAADTRAALEEAGFDCVTYAELLRDLVPLDSYVEDLDRRPRGLGRR